MRKFLPLLLLCLLPAAAMAGMDKPDEINPVIHSTTPYGEGTYRTMMINAYDASLWTDAPTWSMQVPFALAIRYRLHFTPDELSDRTISEMQRQKPLSDDEAAKEKAVFMKLFPDVKKGDVITALYDPKKGVTIYYNGKQTGVIADKDLAQRFVGIWLSDKTSAPELRAKLIRS